MQNYPVWLYFSAMSKIKFIPDTTGTYRILPNSLSHCEEKIKMINFGLCYREIAHYFWTERVGIVLFCNISSNVSSGPPKSFIYFEIHCLYCKKLR